MRLRLLLSSCLTFLRVTFLWVLLLPYATAFVGATSNQLVLIANHDTFPVLMRDSLSAKLLPDEEGHVLMGPKTHLNVLGDVFDFHDGWMSIGDLLLEAGNWLNGFCPWIWGTLVVLQLTRDHLYDGET
jgi:hypothetical protein